MKVDEFNFNLDPKRIAQTPYQKRDDAKLLVCNKENGSLTDLNFSDILNYFQSGDVLVLNNSKVVPFRLHGQKETGGAVEVLLLKPTEKSVFEALAKPQKKLRIGTIITFSAKLTAEVIELKEEGITSLKLNYTGNLYEILDEIGEMPLPPYIKTKCENKADYQTVYAKIDGSAAAPTAGFHFTPELLTALKNKGVEIAEVTLHVGLGTFRPPTVENVLDHKMHKETYFITKETADILNKALLEKRRIVACGTTSVRVLESAYRENFSFVETSAETDIFIYPGYRFRVVSGLITNFHLPKSTLIMLVSAFWTKADTLRAYQHAIENDYLFFSFGDAMFIY